MLDRHSPCFHIKPEIEIRWEDKIEDVRACDDYKQEILMAHLWSQRLIAHNAS